MKFELDLAIGTDDDDDDDNDGWNGTHVIGSAL